MHDVYLFVGLVLAFIAKLSHTMFKEAQVMKRDIVLIIALVACMSAVLLHMVYKCPETEIAEKIAEEIVCPECEEG